MPETCILHFQNVSREFRRFVLLTVVLVTTFTVFTNRVNAQQLNLDADYNAGVTDANSQVYVSKPLADGKVLVGGTFRTINGATKSGIARLNADGSVDNSFIGSADGANLSIYEIVQQSDGKFLIGGGFTSYNGITTSGIIRINADGSRDSTFNQSGIGTTGTVQNITQQTDGKILISGSSISSYNTITRYSVVRLNSDGTLDTSFTSPFTSSQFVEEVDVQTDGKILIAGGFFLNNPNRQDIVRLNTDGSIDSSFNPGGSGTDGLGIYAMTLQADGKILIGGAFQTYNDVSRPSVARLNPNGSLDSSFNPNLQRNDTGGEYFALQADGKIWSQAVSALPGLLFR